MNLRGKDKKSSFFYASLGAVVSISSYRFGLGTLTNPGPGFLPFAGGLLMILLSAIIYLKSSEPDAEGEKLFRVGNQRVLLITLYLILYALFFRKLGFLLGSFILMSLLFQLLERKSWIGSVFVSAATILVSYVIFVVWLKVQFPTGFAGF